MPTRPTRCSCRAPRAGCCPSSPIDGRRVGADGRVPYSTRSMRPIATLARIGPAWNPRFARAGCRRAARSQPADVTSVGEDTMKTILAMLPPSRCSFCRPPDLRWRRNATSWSRPRSADAGKLDPHQTAPGRRQGHPELDVQRARPHQARPDQSGVHRARPRRELDVATPTRPNGPSRSARASPVTATTASSPPRMPPIR